MGTYTIARQCLVQKVVLQANGRRLSVEKFDRENVDKLIKTSQIRQYFPHQKFVPYGITNPPQLVV